jgi:hypothetical protein
MRSRPGRTRRVHRARRGVLWVLEPIAKYPIRRAMSAVSLVGPAREMNLLLGVLDKMVGNSVVISAALLQGPENFVTRQVCRGDDSSEDIFINVLELKTHTWDHSQVPGEILKEPGVSADVGHGHALERVGDKHAGYEVLAVVGEVGGEGVNATLDLAEEVGYGLIIERESAAKECVDNDAAAPNVDFGPCIELAGYNLWRRVVWTAARCLEKPPIAHAV